MSICENKIMYKTFFKEIEKNAILMSAAIGALTASDVARQTREQDARMRLKPLRQDSQYKLQGSNQYQFEGGKHTDLKETTSPHLSLYNP